MDEEESYEHACMRAELLGESPPTRGEYEKEHPPKDIPNENDITEELDRHDTSMNSTHNRMDELNTILSSTQRKINNFKTSAYGSLSNIFRRDSTDIAPKDESSLKSQESREEGETEDPEEQLNSAKGSDETPLNKTQSNKGIDVSQKMTSHLDKLDKLLEKSDRAELSMSAQNKQMKKFLNK